MDRPFNEDRWLGGATFDGRVAGSVWGADTGPVTAERSTAGERLSAELIELLDCPAGVTSPLSSGTGVLRPARTSITRSLDGNGT